MRRALLLALLAAVLFACVPVRRMPLSRPVDATVDGLRVRAGSVSASNAFLSQRGGGPSVLAITASATSSQDETAFLDLAHATLHITDPGGELGEVALAAWTSGSGEAPDAIPPHERAAPIALAHGQSETFWVAFRAAEPLPEADLPRRIVLRIPVTNPARTIEVVVAEPTTGRPRWVHPPITQASYAGVSVIGTPFDEGSFGILRTSWKSSAGRVVFAPSFTLGARAGELRDERERTIACCDLGLSLDLSFMAVRGRDGSFGPYLSYQGVFALESGRHDKATWHGPALGLQFFTRLIEPIVARGLPVRPTYSPLGYSSFTIAYAHMFRRGDPGGSPGMLLLFEHTLPEW